MSNVIKLRRSAVPGNTPTTAQLALGEVAINTHDGKLFIKKDDGAESIVEVGAGGGGIGEAPQDGNYYVRQNGAWVDLVVALSAIGDRTVDGGNFTTGLSDGGVDTVDGGNFTTGSA